MKKKYIIFGITSFLVVFGIIMITSSSYIWAEYKFNNPYKFLINQSIFAIIGFILMIITSKIDYKIYNKYSINIYKYLSFVISACPNTWYW